MPRCPARRRPLAAPVGALALLAAIGLVGCGAPPVPGPAVAPDGPTPRLLPLPELLAAPPPEATAQSAAALAARGTALRAEVLGRP